VAVDARCCARLADATQETAAMQPDSRCPGVAVGVSDAGVLAVGLDADVERAGAAGGLTVAPPEEAVWLRSSSTRGVDRRTATLAFADPRRRRERRFYVRPLESLLARALPDEGDSGPGQQVAGICGGERRMRWRRLSDHSSAMHFCPGGTWNEEE